MNEARLTTIEQIEQFLSATSAVSSWRQMVMESGKISRVLKRFDYPGRRKRDRGVLLRYLQHTSGVQPGADRSSDSPVAA